MIKAIFVVSCHVHGIEAFGGVQKAKWNLVYVAFESPAIILAISRVKYKK